MVSENKYILGDNMGDIHSDPESSAQSNADFISIKDAMKLGKGKVHVRGWVYRERGSNKLKFISLRDSSGIIQCVIEKEKIGEEKFRIADKLHTETSLSLSGEIRNDERAPTGYEINADSFEVIGECENFPISKDFSPEYLLDNRHLWLRSKKMTAVLKIRHTVTGAIHEFFRSRGFYEFNPPIFQPSQCEGGSTLFEVKYFSEKTYLAQSWQLYAEAAIFSLEKIYDIAPSFRAEKSKTSRHLTEYWHAEMEAAWIGLYDAVETAKEEIKFIIQKVLENNEEELKTLGRDPEDLKKMLGMPFRTITYTEALKILKQKSNMEVEWGKDLRTMEEDELMKHFNAPVAVVEYPKEIMAFYKPEKKLGKCEQTDAPGPVALCFDMLAPEGYGEIVGGSQRDTDIDELIKALKRSGEDPKNYKWYLDLRRYGNVPHSGYGMGVERVVAWICKLDNIKDAIPFPRTMLRKSP